MRFRIKPHYGKHKMLMKDGTYKLLKEGDEIDVKHKSELGNTLDKFIQLDPDPPEGGDMKKSKTIFALKRRQGKKGETAVFDVYNKETKQNVNDGGLSKQEAEELIGDMESS